MKPFTRSGDPVAAPAAAPATAREAAVALAQRAAAGDALATRRLLEDVAPRIFRTARALMGHTHPDLEDAVQLSLIGFIQSLPGFRGDCHPSSFAARIAVRTAGAVRRRARARQGGRDAEVEVDTLEGERVDVGAARRRDAIRSLLDELPEEQAEALALRFMLGWSLSEIAEASGAPLNTVRSRLRLAKEALRRRIDRDAALSDEFNDGEEGS